MIFNVGDEYYSVGPLQIGGIELWQFTNDRYDKSRAEIGNMFKTKEEALLLKAMLMEMKELRK